MGDKMRPCQAGDALVAESGAYWAWSIRLSADNARKPLSAETAVSVEMVLELLLQPSGGGDDQLAARLTAPTVSVLGDPLTRHARRCVCRRYPTVAAGVRELLREVDAAEAALQQVCAAYERQQAQWQATQASILAAWPVVGPSSPLSRAEAQARLDELDSMLKQV